MTREELRDELMTQLWRMNRMDMIELLREFIEGETAALWFMASAGKDRVSPSQISDEIRVSRARAANILRSLRSKGFVEMEIASSDRRKMDVRLTDAGRRSLGCRSSGCRSPGYRSLGCKSPVCRSPG